MKHNTIIVQLPLSVDIEPLLGEHDPHVFLRDPHNRKFSPGSDVARIFEYKTPEKSPGIIPSHCDL